MIQANELRVGNWVFHNGDYRKITESEFCIILKWGLKPLSPIPLTEEILIMCGFEKKDQGTICTYFFLGKNPITRDSIIDLTWIKDESGDNFEGFPFYKNGFFEIKYLHQLQNLHFALTGKELEIKF